MRKGSYMEEKFKIVDSEKELEKEQVEELEELEEEQTQVTEDNLEEIKVNVKDNYQENNGNNQKNINSTTKLAIMIIAIVVLIIAIVAVVISSLPKKEKKKEQTTIVTDKQEVKSEYKLVGNHLQEFDISFLKLENNEENTVYSPLSIKYALEMLKEGTNGNSKEQITAILGNYNPKKYVNNANMSFANAMFINQLYKTEIKDEYKKSLIDKYYAEVIYDSFESAQNINKWVSDNTFGLIKNLVEEGTQANKQFYLINALAIDMEWNKKIQSTDTSKMADTYGVSYLHEKYGHYISPITGNNYHPLKFNKEKNVVNSLEIGASINKYDIVKELGEENIRNTITKEYNAFLAKGGCGKNDLDTETYVEKYIKEIDSNYNKLEVSTDFEFYVDENVKVFAKDLKTYENTTLQYVGIMPQKESLTKYVKKTSASEYNELIKKLKKIELGDFKEGVITKITGYIPTFSFEYKLELEENLKKLNVTDIFDEEKADLTGIISKKASYISDALHKANIEFSNEGIKAAAVSGFGGAGSAGCGFEYLYEVPVEIIDLTFDNPYLFFIRDKQTNEIWFTGTVYEPNINIPTNN